MGTVRAEVLNQAAFAIMRELAAVLDELAVTGNQDCV